MLVVDFERIERLVSARIARSFKGRERAVVSENQAIFLRLNLFDVDSGNLLQILD